MKQSYFITTEHESNNYTRNVQYVTSENVLHSYLLLRHRRPGDISLHRSGEYVEIHRVCPLFLALLDV